MHYLLLNVLMQFRDLMEGEGTTVPTSWICRRPMTVLIEVF
jgi:hypothetical protein